MDEKFSQEDRGDAFTSSPENPTSSPEWDATDGEPEPAGELDLPSIAVDVARYWVKDHQKASMLGAFGVGVFVGVLLRE